MPKHSENKQVPYTPNQMFELVSNIEKYPEFLPWCSAARIQREYKVDNNNIIIADLIISFKAFSEKFTSEVTLDRESNQILVNYVDGPFKYLTNHWQFFDGNKTGCTVSFVVDFEFKSKILQALIGMVFNDAMIKIVGAFEDRASTLYDIKQDD